MGLLGSIFGNKSNTEEIKQMLADGAAIIDVRTPGEFQGGHVAGSLNIPLQTIQHKMDDIRKIGKPLVLCCASGQRSAQAASFLKLHGVECENGGGWNQVNKLK